MPTWVRRPPSRQFYRPHKFTHPRVIRLRVGTVVLTFSVVDPQVKRTGGWVAGGFRVRPLGVNKTVRPRT